MFVVIFEVRPKRERWSDYLELAQFLKPKLQAIDGFIDNERFASKAAEGWLLSLSSWRDEKAVIRWRTQGEHHAVQDKGRSEIFADYHLRVGEVTEDSAAEASPQQRFDVTVEGIAKAVTITECRAGQPVDDIPAALGLAAESDGLVSQTLFESITAPGKYLLLAGWTDAGAAAWQPRREAFAELRHRQVRIIRDYGMRDRGEAPQYFPAADTLV